MSELGPRYTFFPGLTNYTVMHLKITFSRAGGGGGGG